MSWKPLWVHFVGLLATAVAAAGLLLSVVPHAARVLFTPPLRGYEGVRFELLYYLLVALIPVALWLVPAFVRQLACWAYGAQRTFLGRSGFYVRYLTETSLRFSDDCRNVSRSFCIGHARDCSGRTLLWKSEP
jgi:hypothetical protein